MPRPAIRCAQSLRHRVHLGPPHPTNRRPGQSQSPKRTMSLGRYHRARVRSGRGGPARSHCRPSTGPRPKCRLGRPKPDGRPQGSVQPDYRCYSPLSGTRSGWVARSERRESGRSDRSGKIRMGPRSWVFPRSLIYSSPQIEPREWRRRMGIEPTTRLVDVSLVLKTREATRPQSPPKVSNSSGTFVKS